MKINPNKCRSLLFTPAHIEKFWSKAISSEADILVLDLEDAVPQNKKEEARKNIPMLLKAKPSSRPLLLRVNNVKSLLFKEDIKIAMSDGIEGIIIPKLNSRKEIEDVIKAIEEVKIQISKPSFDFSIFLMIETAQALYNIKDLSNFSRHIKGLIFGHEDYLFDIGGAELPNNENLIYPRSEIVVSAKSNNLICIDTPFLDISDSKGCYKHALHGRKLGFNGMLVIHPNQVFDSNKGYSPSKQEIIESIEIVNIAKNSSLLGRSIAVSGGKFVAPPIIKQANQLLARAKALNLIDDLVS